MEPAPADSSTSSAPSRLAALTGTGYVDIHSHLLPGIDDGPADLEGSLEMARAAADSGIRVIAATPHLRSDFPGVRVAEIADACRRLQHQIDAAGIDLRVVSGSEASLIWALEAADEELLRATYDQRGTDLLVETPTDVSNLEQLIYQVRVRGVRVTLAHPERSRAFQRDTGRLEHLAEQGVLLQLNADALLAGRWSSTRRLAEQLCRDGLVQVVASDGHRSAIWRPVSALEKAVEVLRRLVGEARAEWMTRDAPTGILKGEMLPEPPESEGVRWAFWRKPDV